MHVSLQIFFDISFDIFLLSYKENGKIFDLIRDVKTYRHIEIQKKKDYLTLFLDRKITLRLV